PDEGTHENEFRAVLAGFLAFSSPFGRNWNHRRLCTRFNLGALENFPPSQTLRESPEVISQPCTVGDRAAIRAGKPVDLRRVHQPGHYGVAGARSATYRESAHEEVRNTQGAIRSRVEEKQHFLASNELRLATDAHARAADCSTELL